MTGSSFFGTGKSRTIGSKGQSFWSRFCWSSFYLLLASWLVIQVNLASHYLIIPTEGEHRMHEASAAPDAFAPRVLLFITTHMSDQHAWYLRNCWGEVFRHSRLLRGADVMVYANPPAEGRRKALEILDRAFSDQKLTVHIGEHKDRFQGAIAAFWYALDKSLFDGYDWIVRANPDVIVRDDRFLVDSIMHDPATRALLINCRAHATGLRKEIRDVPLVHTDFFALRSDLARPRPPNKPHWNAEISFTDYLRGIGGNRPLEIEGLRWIPGADHEGTGCRAGLGKPLNMTPVTHVHELPGPEGYAYDVRFHKDGACPIPFAGDM